MIPNACARIVLSALAGALATGCITVLDFDDYEIPSSRAPDAGRATPPANRDVMVGVTPARLDLRRGARVDVTVTLTRRTVTGPVAIRIGDLPAGVAVDALALADGETTGRLTLTTSDDATLGSLSLRVGAYAGNPERLLASASLDLTVRGTELDHTFGEDGIAVGEPNTSLLDVAYDASERCLLAVVADRSDASSGSRILVLRDDGNGHFTQLVERRSSSSTAALAVTHLGRILLTVPGDGQVYLYGEDGRPIGEAPFPAGSVRGVASRGATTFVLFEDDTTSDLAIIGFDGIGKLQSEFGRSGSVAIETDAPETSAQMGITDRGIVVCSVRGAPTENATLVVRRFSFAGVLDEAFGPDNGSIAIRDHDRDLSCESLASTGAGGFLLGASYPVSSVEPTGPDSLGMLLYGFDGDGLPRRDFATSGVASLELGFGGGRLAFDPIAGRLYTATFTGSKDSYQTVVFAHHRDGSPDRSFGAGSTARLLIPLAAAAPRNEHVTNDGLVVIAGDYAVHDPGTWFVARIRP